MFPILHGFYEDDQIPVLHRIERVFRVRQDILHFSDTYLIRYFRFPRQEIIYLCDLLDPIIGANTNRSHSIPTVTKVLASLGFFASGSFQNVFGRIVGVCQPSCSRILATVLEGLKRLAPTHIVIPLGDPQKIAHLKTVKIMVLVDSISSPIIRAGDSGYPVQPHLMTPIRNPTTPPEIA
uniref:Nuclease HARBI1 n=1 Tax=Timema poppense TaxID=170557 RepID=A0A7R9D6A2_TIMPO|nr:unnamed protein product [Timema poppensis]